MNATGKIIVCSAPSGAGKTTLLEHLGKTVPGLAYSVSATTRKPRPGERHGEHYFFMDTDEFREMTERREFAEWQVVHGNYYGTPKSYVDSTIADGTHLIMDIDVWGRLMFGKSYPDSVGILILPPSFTVLEERLRARKTESEADLKIRLENARKEIETAVSSKGYAYTIINDELGKACNEIVGTVKSITGVK